MLKPELCAVTMWLALEVAFVTHTTLLQLLTVLTLPFAGGVCGRGEWLLVLCPRECRPRHEALLSPVHSLLLSDYNRSVHRPHGFSGIYGFSQRITDYAMEGDDREREMVMVAGPGDLIIHNSLLIHRAPPNTTTDRSRRAVGSIFYGASAVVDEEKYQARQKQIRERAAALEGQTQASVGL